MSVDKVTEAGGIIPPETLGWRLRRALEYAGLSVEVMASEQGVHRGTVTRWMHDAGQPPKRATLVLWSQLTGVPLEWLRFGEVEPATPSTPGKQTPGRKKSVVKISKKRPPKVSDTPPYRLGYRRMGKATRATRRPTTTHKLADALHGTAA